MWLHFSFDLLFYLIVWGFPHHSPLSGINYCNYPTFNSCWFGICRKYPRKCITMFICISEKRWRWIGTFPQLHIDLNRRRGSCQMDFLFAYLICVVDTTEQANIWMPGSATSVGISGGGTALLTLALSPHCLSLEWVSAEHSHQLGCRDTQTTGIAILVVLYETATGASLMGRWMPGKIPYPHQANAYPCTSQELQRSETYSLSLPWGQVLQIFSSPTVRSYEVT